MEEEQRTRGGEEIRSPLQVFIRVLLALLIVVVLGGLILAVVLRPEETIEPPEAAMRSDVLGASPQPDASRSPTAERSS